MTPVPLFQKLVRGSALLAWILVCSTFAVSCESNKPYSYEFVSFDDIAPSYITLTQSWNALGVDDKDNVFVIWTSTRDDGREDAALFRYTKATGERKFLGTFIDVATAQNNLLEGEEIPKGHTHIVQVGRKLYMGSQGFHDFKGEIDTLPNYRGAHLFSYDLDTGAFDDVSRTLPGGVVIEHQGIVALAYSPEHKVLVGLAHPLGDIVLFDIAKNEVRKVVPGIPWEANHYVSRELLVTHTGKVYTYRGAEEPEFRGDENEVWVYDIATDESKGTGQLLKGGFWNGQAATRDRETVYISTVSGQLYRFDVQSETFTDLGYFIDPDSFGGENQYRIIYLYGIALSAAEGRIVGVPIISASTGPESGNWLTRITSYNVANRQFTANADVDPDVWTGSNNRDSAGNIYMSAFDWTTNCSLAILSPPQN